MDSPIDKYAVINIEANEVFVRSVYKSVALFITRSLYAICYLVSEGISENANFV